MAIKAENLVGVLKALAALLPAVVTLMEKRLNWFSINPMVRKGLTEAAIVFSIVSFVVLWYIVGRRKQVVAATMLAGALLAAFSVLAFTETDLSESTHAPFGVMCAYVLLFAFLGGSLGAAMSRPPSADASSPTLAPTASATPPSDHQR